MAKYYVTITLANFLHHIFWWWFRATWVNACVVVVFVFFAELSMAFLSWHFRECRLWHFNKKKNMKEKYGSQKSVAVIFIFTQQPHKDTRTPIPLHIHGIVVFCATSSIVKTAITFCVRAYMKTMLAQICIGCAGQRVYFLYIPGAYPFRFQPFDHLGGLVRWFFGMCVCVFGLNSSHLWFYFGVLSEQINT